eukprot:gnl/MRDRNA2_/MRDRNA2_72277_c0_seq2.p1 gnl/MRDRNA2_/MRDRNA2_72277_c0~~gnl/MRDRNA2_/MRDRNA2_72277_c0_seq2.p1  ORF type:complete len:107 (-),score=1.69 gnl/MRDRNA2_/MRDRNA2_72277_c0_seq2:592-912(-)
MEPILLQSRFLLCCSTVRANLRKKRASEWHTFANDVDIIMRPYSLNSLSRCPAIPAIASKRGASYTPNVIKNYAVLVMSNPLKLSTIFCVRLTKVLTALPLLMPGW